MPQSIGDGWIEYQTDAGEYYYHNHLTNVTTWDIPVLTMSAPQSTQFKSSGQLPPKSLLEEIRIGTPLKKTLSSTEVSKAHNRSGCTLTSNAQKKLLSTSGESRLQPNSAPAPKSNGFADILRKNREAVQKKSSASGTTPSVSAYIPTSALNAPNLLRPSANGIAPTDKPGSGLRPYQNKPPSTQLASSSTPTTTITSQATVDVSKSISARFVAALRGDPGPSLPTSPASIPPTTTPPPPSKPALPPHPSPHHPCTFPVPNTTAPVPVAEAPFPMAVAPVLPSLVGVGMVFPPAPSLPASAGHRPSPTMGHSLFDTSPVDAADRSRREPCNCKCGEGCLSNRLENLERKLDLILSHLRLT